MRTLWIFPGQGDQRPGMLGALEPALKAQVCDLAQVELSDDEAAYRDPVEIQLAILALQLDQAAKLTARGWKPQAVAGHSLGIFAAAVSAGVLSVPDAIRLVAKRARLMAGAYPSGYGMGVVVGLRRSEVEQLVARVRGPQSPVYASNQNAELQTALSGRLDAIKQVLELARQAGAQKARLLHVPVPSHSPLFTQAAAELTGFVDSLELHEPDPQVAYLANWNGRRLRTADQIAFDLANNLRFPVYWDTMMAVAAELDVTASLELGPGDAFSRLVKMKFPDMKTLSLTGSPLDDVDYLLTKWKGVN